MSDRSDEVTRSQDAPGTDDLLEETDRLLSESGADVGDASHESAETSPGAAGGDGRRESAGGFDRGRDLERERQPESDREADAGSSRSWLPTLPSRFSLGGYFSPKGYLALVLVLSASLLAGATVLPFAGRLIGMFAAAFTIGLLASKRRYLEMGAAGASVGGVGAVLNHVFIAALGTGQTLVAVGATVGLLASVVGYYFGRDLRNGLSRDVD
ncbi:DUF456 domain-containing protein [Natrinema longum]|uniref:DUF456 domain-containing protein n=1 Tax=Natrinema longum TaxID=370324 RepID=A0A8A2U8Y5_9EURY|nr:DUF456 domain-containing protein [Natrinema longum]MBZ6493492.1 DUF456 domain-containing protein [Natrinema longum]QSW85160.1 DUF456 domain-containing protein [Natrinema longum]